MHPILKNGLAVGAGVVLGGIVNMAIVLVSGAIIPAPNGGVVTSMEGLRAKMHLFEPKHFIFPFLAHAFGTLTGAAVATKIAASRPILVAFSVGLIFLIGGTINISMLGGPMWFNALDLIVAYIPMSYLGWKLVGNKYIPN